MKQASGIVRPKGRGQNVQRVLLFAVLGLFCVYYLVPLFVMVSTSLKSLAEIREGSLLAFPRAVSGDATYAYSQEWFCIVQASGAIRLRHG